MKNDKSNPVIPPKDDDKKDGQQGGNSDDKTAGQQASSDRSGDKTDPMQKDLHKEIASKSM